MSLASRIYFAAFSLTYYPVHTYTLPLGVYARARMYPCALL